MAIAGHVIQARVAARGMPICSRLARNPSHCVAMNGRSSSEASRAAMKDAFHLAGFVVNRPAETHGGLTVVFEVAEDAY